MVNWLPLLNLFPGHWLGKGWDWLRANQQPMAARACHFRTGRVGLEGRTRPESKMDRPTDPKASAAHVWSPDLCSSGDRSRYYVEPDCQSIDPSGGEEFRQVFAARDLLRRARFFPVRCVRRGGLRAGLRQRRKGLSFLSLFPGFSPGAKLCRASGATGEHRLTRQETEGRSREFQKARGRSRKSGDRSRKSGDRSQKPEVEVSRQESGGRIPQPFAVGSWQSARSTSIL